MSEPIPSQTPDEEIEKVGNLDDYSRDEQAEKIIRFMDKLHAPEIFADEKSKRGYIQNITFEEFKDLLTATNSMLRDIPVNQRSIDGENVFLKGGGLAVDDEYIPPQYDDKDALLQEMFANVQSMNQENRSFEDMALLVGASINAIHPFNDGNGRTSRLLYTFIKNNYDGTNEQRAYLTEILGEEGRYKVDVNPAYVGTAINKTIAKQLGLNLDDRLKPIGLWGGKQGKLTKKEIDEVFANMRISEDNKKFLDTLARSHEGHDYAHGFFAIHQFLAEKGISEKYKKTFFEDNNPKLSRILIVPVISELSDDDIEQIRNYYREIKKTHIEILIDSIVNPENHKTTKPDGTQTTFLEVFKDRSEK